MPSGTERQQRILALSGVEGYTAGTRNSTGAMHGLGIKNRKDFLIPIGAHRIHRRLVFLLSSQLGRIRRNCGYHCNANLFQID
jgi:hypothetical protein